MTLIAHHIILTGYGHWLPNDPRGSMSHEIRAPKIAELGPPHHGRKPVQPSLAELREFHLAAKESLALQVLWWDDVARQTLADAFGEAATSQGLTCYGCAVVRNHAHLLLRRHRLKGEEIRDAMKRAGRDKLIAMEFAPKDHPVFSADSCDVYKRSQEEVRSCVNYIWSNYSKHNLSPALCPWVIAYDGWPSRR